MIDWVHESLKAWGRAKRSINGIPDLEPPKDGHSCHRVRSFFGRIMEEGPVGAAIHQPAKPLEVMLGDALEAAIAIGRALESGSLTERQHEVVFVHYVIHGPVKVKAHKLNLSRAAYYDHLNNAHRRLAAHFPGVDKKYQYGT